MGHQYKDSELIQVCKSCLDYPLFSEEVTELKILGYWDFVDYLNYRFRVAQVIVNSESSAKMAARTDSSASMGLMPELSAFTDTTSVSPVVVNGATEVCKATPRLTRLVSKLAETPLMSVRAVWASIKVSATIPLSFALPVTNLASVCAGTEDSSLALGSVPAYKAVLVQELTPEPTPVN